MEASTRTRIKLGDVFEIRLPDRGYAYCQYVEHNDTLGYLVRVFEKIFQEPLSSVSALDTTRLLFPPVFVGLRATVRSKRWKLVGNLPIGMFSLPTFRQTIGTKPGTYSDWTTWDGVKTIRYGKLPKPLRALELECVWGDEALEGRIINGTYRGDFMF